MSGLSEFADLVGQVPNDKLAEIAQVPLSEVEAAVVAKEAETEPPEKPAKPKPAKPKAEKPAPAPAEPEVDEQILRLAYAAQKKIDAGWTVSEDGELVPPAGSDGVEIEIRTLKMVPYKTKNRKGRDVTIVLPRSVYRGDMARRVMSLVPPSGYERLKG